MHVPTMAATLFPNRFFTFARYNPGRIPASDAAAILGLNPYCSRKQVLDRKVLGHKRTICPPNDHPPLERRTLGQQHGMQYEAEALAKYARVMRRKVERVGLVVHKDYDFLSCIPDGVTDLDEVVEVKCPYTRKIRPCHVPEYYIPQLQLQMEILDLPMCHYVEYKPGKSCAESMLQILRVPRDKVWFQKQLNSLHRASQEIIERRRLMNP